MSDRSYPEILKESMRLEELARNETDEAKKVEIDERKVEITEEIERDHPEMLSSATDLVYE